MRGKLTMVLTQCFIGTYHLCGKHVLFSAKLFQCPFYHLLPCFKEFKAISSLLLGVMLNLSFISTPTLTQSLCKKMWSKRQFWGELLTDLLPALIGTLCRHQEHAIHVKKHSLGECDLVLHAQKYHSSSITGVHYQCLAGKSNSVYSVSEKLTDLHPHGRPAYPYLSPALFLPLPLPSPYLYAAGGLFLCLGRGKRQ